MGCDGLEKDVSRFRSRNTGAKPMDPSCKLCDAESEVAAQSLTIKPWRASERTYYSMVGLTMKKVSLKSNDFFGLAYYLTIKLKCKNVADFVLIAYLVPEIASCFET